MPFFRPHCTLWYRYECRFSKGSKLGRRSYKAGFYHQRKGASRLTRGSKAVYKTSTLRGCILKMWLYFSHVKFQNKSRSFRLYLKNSCLSYSHYVLSKNRSISRWWINTGSCHEADSQLYLQTNYWPKKTFDLKKLFSCWLTLSSLPNNWKDA